MTTKTIKATAKFFAGFPRQTLPVMVEDDGTVRVYDSVAGHYTSCHSLSAKAIRRIRRIANARP